MKERLERSEETGTGRLHSAKSLFTYETAMKMKPRGKALDIGCGTGSGLKILARKFKTVGIDNSTEAIAKSKEIKGCKLILGDVCSLPFNDCEFDLIVSNHVIEHIFDDKKFVNEVMRVLKPNGIAVITTPNRKLRLRENQKPWNKWHIREYSKETIKELFSKSGMDVTIKGISVRDDIMAVEMRRLRLRKVIPRQLFDMLLKIMKPNDANSFSPTLDDFRITNDTDNALDLIVNYKKLTVKPTGPRGNR